VERIVTRRKRDKTAGFNPLSHGYAVTAPLVNKWSLRALNYHLSVTSTRRKVKKEKIP